MTLHSSSSTIVLEGERNVIQLEQVRLNEKTLTEGADYQLQSSSLTIFHIPLDCPVRLETIVTTVPEGLTGETAEMSGLFQDSIVSGMYFTQMEPMGFRRFTYMADRPDQMAIFTKVRIEADQKNYPILLSNGNLLEQGVCEHDPQRHYAIWQDPFPKPTYLFAMVAGDLGVLKDQYTTRSGRQVDLQLFADPGDTHLLKYALECLKKSMIWDEENFDLEYDLEVYSIVATSSYFPWGGMENKGLNIFGDDRLLADINCATDTDVEDVESSIGHEYFHNWTGNRMTCRDWFQLALKEGLTVFREQEFSADMNGKAVNRIKNVRALRSRQFAEDAGPMSHPIRPESYQSMDNLYTETVYFKGAEVTRLYQTILGVEGFKQGLKLYLERHDGQAVTCDDFLQAMQDANPGVDLTQFSRWYSTAGTPVVKYRGIFREKGTFQLHLQQETRDGTPLHIPVAVGLLDHTTGKEVVPTTVLHLKESQQTFEFNNLQDLVPLDNDSDAEQASLAFLAAHDTDDFNRWEAVQKLYTTLIFQNYSPTTRTESELTWNYIEQAFQRTLDTCMENPNYKMSAFVLTLPFESTRANEIDDDSIEWDHARSAVQKRLARHFQSVLLEKYQGLTELLSQNNAALRIDAESIGLRSLRNVLLDYLCSIDETPEERQAALKLATDQYESAPGWSDQGAAFDHTYRFSYGNDGDINE